MRVLVVTISDRCSKGECLDQSGPKITEIVAAFAEATGRTITIQSSLVPDELDRIQRIITQATDRSDPQFPTLILTTGGTGFGVRDITPEAVRPLLDKEAPGVSQYMLHLGLQHTSYAWLSRAIAGVRKRSVIVCLPGNPKAIVEVLPSLLENGLVHAMQLASGEGGDDATQHNPSQNALSSAYRERSKSNSPAPSVSVPSVNRASPPRHHDGNELVHRGAPLVQHVGLHMTPLRVPAQSPLVVNQLTPRRTTSEAAPAPLPAAVEMSPPRNSSGRVAGPSTAEAARPNQPSPVREAHAGAVAWRDRESRYPMMPMTDAIQTIVRVTESCGMRRTATVPIHRALGHILAESVVSEFNHPPFRASIKDGYAVVAADGPGLYPLVGSLVAGSQLDGFTLLPRQVCRVNTGGPVPPGADAVVQVEDTKAIDTSPDGEELTVLVMSRAQPGQDIRPVGCDLKEGAVALDAGVVLHAPEIGLAMSVGATALSVFRKPTVAILSTGDELEDPARRRGIGAKHAPSSGKIFDSNKPMLMAAAVESGFEVHDAGIARDTMSDTREKLQSAWEAADVIVSSGGVSMGEVDCVKKVLLEMGATIHFGRVNMKPGKPTTFASLGTKLFFALPGNPVSAMVCYHLFVVPALKAASGMPTEPLVVKARLSQDFRLDAQRPEYHRCRLTRQLGSDGVSEEFVASSTGSQASHRLTSMAGANGMVVLPAGEGCMARNTLADVVVIGAL